jgi:hypothetical protein
MQSYIATRGFELPGLLFHTSLYHAGDDKTLEENNEDYTGYDRNDRCCCQMVPYNKIILKNGNDTDR